MKLDIATTALLAQLASADGPPMYELSPDEARMIGEGMAGAYPDGPEMAESKDIEIPASDGARIRARIHRPLDKPKGVMVFYHGGGWVLSNIDQYDCVGRQLAERTGLHVLEPSRIGLQAAFDALSVPVSVPAVVSDRRGTVTSILDAWVDGDVENAVVPTDDCEVCVFTPAG